MSFAKAFLRVDRLHDIGPFIHIQAKSIWDERIDGLGRKHGMSLSIDEAEKLAKAIIVRVEEAKLLRGVISVHSCSQDD